MLANFRRKISRLVGLEPADNAPALPAIEAPEAVVGEALAGDALAEPPQPVSEPAPPPHPLDGRPGWHRTDGGWAYRRPVEGVSANYRRIDRETAEDAGRQAWHFRDVAERQHSAYASLLADLERGSPRRDFAVAAEALRRTRLADLSLVEIGCGSGYYSQVFDRLLPGAVRYTGVDISGSMIGIARAQFGPTKFEVADACRLPFPDAAFDVAMNGVSLMHIVDYASAIRETRRVAKQFCLFHTMIVAEEHETFFLEKDAYGRPTVEVILGAAEFLQLCEQEGLQLVETWDSIAYDLTSQVGIRTTSRSYLFKVVGPSRTSVSSVPVRRPPRAAADAQLMLNLGCGARHHADWINLDIASSDPSVITHDLTQPLPFVVETFDCVYHSHVLEHLPKAAAPGFLAECHRVVAPGGIIRVAIPDLEQIARLYVEAVAGAAAGDQKAMLAYDWIIIELLDQIVRQRSGGEMLEYWRQDPMPAGDFVMQRVGQEAARAIAQIQAGRVPPAPTTPPTAEEVGQFRSSGEIHQWMYDRFSLARLLRQAGFANPVVVRADESSIDGFARFELDTMPDGSTRKPDSLFMEAERP